MSWKQKPYTKKLTLLEGGAQAVWGAPFMAYGLDDLPAKRLQGEPSVAMKTLECHGRAMVVIASCSSGSEDDKYQ